MLCISNWVMGTEDCPELQDKFPVVLHPDWTKVRVICLKQIWFEAFQHHTFEVGLHGGDFGSIGPESVWMILEVRLALNQKGPEVAWICIIESVQFSDLCVLQGFRIWFALSGGCKVTDSMPERGHGVKQKITIWSIIVIVIVVVVPRIIAIIQITRISSVV